MFDGEKPASTFRKFWVSVDHEPKKITEMVKQPNVNHRYKLINKSLLSDKFPEFIPEDEAKCVDGDGCKVWKNKYAGYDSLYSLTSDPQPDKEVEVEFSLEVALNVDKIEEPAKMGYKVEKVNRDGWVKERSPGEITENDVVYQLADRVILPGLLLPQRPCRFTSKQTYDIVRQYVKDHIDPSMAVITSDHDFCFEVKRRIRLAQVVKYTVDVNNSIFDKRKRKPKYVEKQKSERTETCFEMTHDQERYKNYSIISGFEADNQHELKRKIDDYCESLIEFINVKFEECVHCSGNGVMISEQKASDLRNMVEKN
jgi:hypothetical protein